MSSYIKIDAQKILIIAQKTLDDISQQHIDDREKDITNRMTKRKWFGLGSYYTREEATEFVHDNCFHMYAYYFQYRNILNIINLARTAIDNGVPTISISADDLLIRLSFCDIRYKD
jgi:hypothetical protein